MDTVLLTIRRMLEKRANVTTANGPVMAPGSSNMPGKGYGAANIPGMSVHCLQCGAKLKKQTPTCPVCKSDTSNVLDMEASERDHTESGETGGEASVNEEKAKLASRYAKLPLPLRRAIGAAAAATGVYGAAKSTQLMSPLPEKVAAMRMGNPVLRLRKPGIRGDVHAAVGRMLRATRKARARLSGR